MIAQIFPARFGGVMRQIAQEDNIGMLADREQPLDGSFHGFEMTGSLDEEQSNQLPDFGRCDLLASRSVANVAVDCEAARIEPQIVTRKIGFESAGEMNDDLIHIANH